MVQAKKDENGIPVLMGVSNVDGVTPVMVYVDPVTHRLLVDFAGGSGTVTSMSIVTANGISGSVATPTTTPAVTLTLGAITPTSVNALTLASQAVGFTIAGGTTAKTLTVDTTVATSAQELIANKSTDTALGTSDTLYPSQKAVKTYADSLVTGLLDYRGAYDASVNTFPAAGGSGTAGAVLKGDMWILSVAGTLGGVAVQIGDSVIANVDTPGQTAGNWNILNSNISYVPEDVANKVTSISGASTDTQYPSAKLVYDQLALKAAVAQTFYIGTTQVAINRASAALTLAGLTLTTPDIGTPSAGVLTNATGLPIAGLVASTSTALGVGSIELGHATDTTISRSAAGVIAVEGVVIPSISSTNTLTNKRITKRTGTTTSSATPTINTDDVDEYYITAQAADITSFTTNLSGTPTLGQTLFISVIGTAARAITWGASFANGPVALPTTTVTTTQLSTLFKWDGSIWRCYATGSTV